MELFESYRKKFFRNMLVVFPLLFLLVIASVFFAGVSFTSKDTLQNHITYDSSRCVIEYVPNGSNLFPMISVIPLSVSFSNRKEAAS